MSILTHFKDCLCKNETQWLVAIIVLTTLCYSFSSKCNADTGEVAYAYPVENLKIDGDLSDWPKGIAEIPIDTDYFGNDPPNAKDFQAKFRAGYNLENRSLYFAVVVNDESEVGFKDESKPWNLQDSLILYVDPTHSPRGSGYWLFAAMKHRKELDGIENTWDPVVPTCSWDDAEVKVVRNNSKTIYEWRIGIGDAMKPGRSVGLDFLICDTDEEDDADAGTIAMWGRFSAKSRGASRIGDLILVKPDAQLGTVSGKIQWQSKPESQFSGSTNDFELPVPKRIRFTSLDNPNMWIQIQGKDDGTFSAELPEGQYILTSPFKTMGSYGENFTVVEQVQPVRVTIKNGKETAAEPLLLRSKPPTMSLPEKGVLLDFNETSEKMIDAAVKEQMEYLKVPGISLALVHDGKLVYHKVHGVKNYYTQEPVTKDTLFEAASITKIVFAFAVNRLAERGEIDLDKPLYQYLPFEEMAHDERYKKITARMCLSHQTGFPNWAYVNDDGKLDIKFYPGIKFGYSGEGFEYLGRVVAKITGKSLEKVIMDEVQVPMGFETNTYFSACPELRKVASYGHFSTRTTAHGFPDALGTAHSMYTEAGVFSNFMIGLLEQKGLSKKGYQAMFEPQVEVPISDDNPLQWPRRYGLGFHLMNSPHGLTFGHGGSNGNFMCKFEAYKDKKMGFIVFTNGDNGEVFQEWLRDLLIIGKRPDSKDGDASNN